MNEPYIKTDTDSLKASISDKQGLRPVVLRMRTGARIAAVQLAYSVGMTQAGLPDAVPEFLDHYGSVIAGQLKVKKIDEEHFQSLTLGVSHEAEQLDKEISESLSDGWTMQRLALHELSVLRAGIYELKAMPHIPAKAVLSEYSGLADVFQCDVGFVNAVLDKLARNYRKQELSGS